MTYVSENWDNILGALLKLTELQGTREIMGDAMYYLLDARKVVSKWLIVVFLNKKGRQMDPVI